MVEYCFVRVVVLAPLQDQALVLLLLLSQEGCACGRLENFADAMVGFGRAFEILVSTDLLADFLALHTNISLRILKRFKEGGAF